MVDHPLPNAKSYFVRTSASACIGLVFPAFPFFIDETNAFCKFIDRKIFKSIGIGKKDIPFKFGNVEINPGSWIYVDFNGWVVSKKELKL